MRAFDNENITHVEDTVNPVRDLEIIQNELRIKDEETLERQIMELTRQASREPTKKTMIGLSKRDELNIIEKVAEFMTKGRDVRKGEWTVPEVNVINTLHLLTAKPMIYLCNVSEEEYIANEGYKW